MKDVIAKIRKELFALCEDTEQKYAPYADRDSTQGHFSRGRIAEAKSIRKAMGDLLSELQRVNI